MCVFVHNPLSTDSHSLAFMYLPQHPIKVKAPNHDDKAVTSHRTEHLSCRRREPPHKHSSIEDLAELKLDKVHRWLRSCFAPTWRGGGQSRQTLPRQVDRIILLFFCLPFPPTARERPQTRHSSQKQSPDVRMVVEP